MSVGRRLRFEVLKRDGFRCRYCGVTSFGTELHVDHVIAVANGGTDDPENLVAACQPCNGGKSAVPLGDVIQGGAVEDAAEHAREHAEQVRELLVAQQETEAARAEVIAWVRDIWHREVGAWGPHMLDSHLRSALSKNQIGLVVDAIRAVALATNAGRLSTPNHQIRYFHACVRNMRMDA